MTILERYAGLVIDLDGVVFRAEEAIPAAIEALRRLDRDGVPRVFVTNNSTRRPADWSRRLREAGCAVDEGDVLTSAMAAAWLLRDDPPPRTYAIGEVGLLEVLADEGIHVQDTEEGAEAVVVGWDRQVTWDALRRATLAIHRGARFVGTNGDPVFPAPEGPWPGNGAALAFLRTATGVDPELAGKPQTPLFELAADRLDVTGPILMVGDQVATDVLGAQRMGWDSVLALTGVSGWPSLVGGVATPTWVIADLGELDTSEPPTVRPAGGADHAAVRELTGTPGDRDGDGDVGTLVADAADGTTVGAVTWEVHDDVAHVRALAVADDQRGRGIRTLLVARALDALQRRGVRQVRADAGDAGEVLDRLGFAPPDEVPDEPPDEDGADLRVRRLEPGQASEANGPGDGRSLTTER